MDIGHQLARSQDISTKVSLVFRKRAEVAQRNLNDALRKAYEESGVGHMKPDIAVGDARLDRLGLVRGRRRAALGAVLGHDAPARQQLPRARAKAGSRRCCTSTTRRCWTARKLARPVNYALLRIVPPEGRDRRSEAPPLRDHRPARRPRPGHRRLQGRLAGRRRAARGPPGLLRDLLPRPGAGPDAARRLRGRAAVRAQGARAASGQPEAGDRRQLPGRLGGDDAGRRRPGRHRADRDQRRADVLLGRRVAGRRGRQPDALRRRHARRHLARRR